MTWLPTSIGSRIDDARRRLEAAEADARAFAARAKTAAVNAIAGTDVAASSMTGKAPREAPDPPPAVLEQTARAAAEFAKVKAAEARSAMPSSVLPSLPLPTASPAHSETGGTIDRARPYVMLAGGFASGVVTGKLGPAGAVAQRVADAAVDRYGTAEDKFNFGYGQLGAAVVVGVQGATMMGEGGAAETATLGVATPIAVPVAVAGAVQVAVAASHADGAIGLMSKGASGTSRSTASTAVAATPTGFKPGELDNHFAKHAAEWPPGLTKEQYLRGARELLSRPPGGDILGHTRANGDVLRYNKASNELAVMAQDGTIRTFFRPSAGIDYWNAQVTP